MGQLEDSRSLIATHKTISVRDYFTAVASISSSVTEELHFVCVAAIERTFIQHEIFKSLQCHRMLSVPWRPQTKPAAAFQTGMRDLVCDRVRFYLGPHLLTTLSLIICILELQ